MPTYNHDRFLRYDELTALLHETAAAYPTLMTVQSYGISHEGRDLWLATITDSHTGSHDSKSAHWVDANIHSVEVTASVAALRLINHLVTGYGTDATVTRALQTRTFYVVPRVNPDGVEWALADSPQYRRSSTRAWPWNDAHRASGLHEQDMDGDGRVLSMRIVDPNGSWMKSTEDGRLMVPVPIDGTPADVTRYRIMYEGDVVDHDGFTIPIPDSPQSLDLNRNFPAGWATNVYGSGDHPLSEPEIDALVRAIVARPNICGYNAYHTSGGVLLRPSSTQADSALAPFDVWAWKQLGQRGLELTGYPVHSVFEDFTWDKTSTMSGAADDWVYEHLGVFGWTTEFWDIVRAATGEPSGTDIWYVGPSAEQELAVLRWADANHPEIFIDWYSFEHPQLGSIELGGWDFMNSWVNPPFGQLAAEVDGHAEFAVYQALAAPSVEIVHTAIRALGGNTWSVQIGIANTGWLPTAVSVKGSKDARVLPLVAELSGADVAVVDGTARRELGQLEGRSAIRFNNSHDGTPDRVSATWVVSAPANSIATIDVSHPRAGRTSISLTIC